MKSSAWVAIAICIAVAGCSKKLAPTEPVGRLDRTASRSGLATPGAAPTPGVIAGGFCTSGTGALKTSPEDARRINQYFAAGAIGSEIFHVGDPASHAYTWLKTGTTVTVTRGNQTASVDAAVAAVRAALGSGGRPGAFSTSATNPTDMGTGGTLGSQA